MALSQNKQTLLRLTGYVWTASYLLDCGRRSGKEKTAVNKIMRVQTRFHHSVQTSTATSAAEVTVELVCKRNSPRQLTGGEHKEDKNTKCNMWGSKKHMLYDQAVRSKINYNKIQIQERNTCNSTDTCRKQRLKYQFCCYILNLALKKIRKARSNGYLILIDSSGSLWAAWIQ